MQNIAYIKFQEVVAGFVHFDFIFKVYLFNSFKTTITNSW